MNLVMEMEARNIVQWYVCHLGDGATRTHGKLQQALEIVHCQQHKPFAGTKCFLKAVFPVAEISEVFYLIFYCMFQEDIGNKCDINL